MSLKKHKLQVLTILSDNLKNTQPQLVPSTRIADKMKISIPQLQQVLKCMEGGGEIETDPDLQFNLITLKGLRLLNEERQFDKSRHTLSNQEPF